MHLWMTCIPRWMRTGTSRNHAAMTSSSRHQPGCNTEGRWMSMSNVYRTDRSSRRDGHSSLSSTCSLRTRHVARVQLHISFIATSLTISPTYHDSACRLRHKKTSLRTQCDRKFNHLWLAMHQMRSLVGELRENRQQSPLLLIDC